MKTEGRLSSSYYLSSLSSLKGGVIAVRADNNEINSILDLKDKVIGAGAISMIMAAQLQFYEMEMAGLSYVNDPKQVVFTGNQFDVGK